MVLERDMTKGEKQRQNLRVIRYVTNKNSDSDEGDSFVLYIMTSVKLLTLSPMHVPITSFYPRQFSS